MWRTLASLCDLKEATLLVLNNLSVKLARFVTLCLATQAC